MSDEQSIRARNELGDLVGSNGHGRHGADREQDVGGEILRHGIGNAVHARASRAQPRKDVGGDGWQI
jgi:hypothetical protein